MTSDEAVIDGPPFELDVPTNIHLALSGGGYRAAAFHLGMFSVLDHLGLRTSVRAISSVSGGSILTGMYLRAELEKTSFPTFFKATIDTLSSTNVVESALTNLDVQEPSLIGAAANVYAGSQFAGDVRFADIVSMDTHVEEIAINATEFDGGNSFRFIRSQSPLAHFGNGIFRIDRKTVAPRIRLADAMAASSCFPGAFEPMRFPHDFQWDGDSPEELKEWAPLPLMDGGIYDNQGISSLLLVNRRGAEPADLIMISDTFQWKRPLFRSETWTTPGNQWRVVAVATCLGLLVAFAFAGGAFLTWTAIVAEQWLLAAVLGLASLPWLLVVLLPFWAWRRTHSGLLAMGFNPDVALNGLGGLGIRAFVRFLSVRIGSVLAMAEQVFMKIVRENVYAAAFREANVPEYRIVTNEIFDLRRTNAPQMSAALEDVVRKANEMPTILWVENPEQLRDTIACGQITTCYNLLSYVEEFSDAPEFDELAGPLKELGRRLINLISAFQEAPHHLTEAIIREARP